MSESKKPDIISSSSVMHGLSVDLKRQGKTIAFVPTMGALHEGHLSLVSKADDIGDETFVSIFVNPKQFGENEDFDKYTRDLQGDIEKLSDFDVHSVFAPTMDEIYPPGFNTTVEVNGLQDCMCGLHRPGHFKGVTTVVSKLFNIVMPDFAVFGLKDYQQLKIIEKMTDDLSLGVEIVPMPIVREDDGLALSSRNKYLNSDERTKALSLSKALSAIKQKFDEGCNEVSELLNVGNNVLKEHGVDSVDYLDIRDAEKLTLIKTAESGNLVALAVRIGETRLIDNMML